jgi:hypothetical protein
MVEWHFGVLKIDSVIQFHNSARIKLLSEQVTCGALWTQIARAIFATPDSIAQARQLKNIG